MTSSAVTGLGRVISHYTVRRWLRQHGIRAYRPFRGITLTRQYRLWCLHWARNFQHWNWQRVLLSERWFQLFRADGKTRIYQRAGENSSVLCSGDCTVCGSICTVWGSICGLFGAVSVANRGTLLSLTETLLHTVASTRFYVPSCYHSCNTNLDQCQTSHSSCGATVLCHKQRQCFAMASPFIWPVTDRTFVGSSWANSTSS